MARPNLLIITTDQQRFDTLAAAGNPHVRTPQLDALAARGVLFRRGYIQSPTCIPSRACIQTGRYTHQHGVYYTDNVIDTTPGLPPWERTVMERLQEVGYTTAGFGNIHMMPPKGLEEMQLTTNKGSRWTVAEGSPLGPAPLGPIYAQWLEGRRPGAYEEIYAQRRRPEYREQAMAIVNVLDPDEYVDYWIAENSWRYLDRDHERPFFLWCGFCGPHPPYDPPEPYASMYRPEDIPVPALLHARQQNVPDGDRPTRFDQPDGEQLIRKITAHYWGMVSFVDDMVGRIMEVLTRRGLWDNTMVVFTTDHGDLLGDFGKLGKSTFLEPVIRAPYIVVPPGTSPAPSGHVPRAFDGLVEHVDLAPTFLDYAGVEHTADLPGRSLRPVLEGTGELPALDGILCEYTSNERDFHSKCLRTVRYKYVITSSAHVPSRVELYDLEQDPQETTNVAGDPSYRDELARHAELLRRLTLTERNPWNSGGATATPAAVDQFGLPITANGAVEAAGASPAR
jgi:arylsulfatase